MGCIRGLEGLQTEGRMPDASDEACIQPWPPVRLSLVKDQLQLGLPAGGRGWVEKGC